jgi:drug/metabolite transporter (DMT)-like permease
MVFIAVVLWGTSFVATKLVLRELPVISLITARFGLGCAFLAVLSILSRRPFLPPRDAVPALAAMGFVGVFVHQLVQAHGLALTSAMNTGWLIGLIPLWSATLARIFLRERLGPLKVAGLGIGFVGAALVVTRGRITPDVLAFPTTHGDLLVLASTLNWAIYTVMGHRTLKALGPTRATSGVMILGWLMLVPLFLVHGGWRPLGGLSPTGWGALLFLGLGCSGLGYLFWYGGIEKLGATRVAAFLYLEPLVTLVAANRVLDEPILPLAVAGGLLVLAGVLLVQRPGRNASAAPRWTPPADPASVTHDPRRRP